MLKTVRSACWRLILGSASLRKRLGFQLKHYYPADLDVRLPLGGGVVTPVFDEEIGCSFSEIFLQNEYSSLTDHIPLPRRWVDLGCYGGFFSLWLLWRHRQVSQQDDFQALLVDADSERAQWVRRVIDVNGLSNQMKFHLGAIADGEGVCQFAERGYMESALSTIPGAPRMGRVVDVPILTPRKLQEDFPGPIDLIKVDIEGAEYYLLNNYTAFVQNARYLLLEWHSWHPGNGGAEQIEKLVADLGFLKISDIQPVRSVKIGETGVSLYKNTRFEES